MTERIFKTLLVFFLAFFCISVALNNIIDWNINFSFVKQVVSMDTMPEWFDKSIISERSISNHEIHVLCYAAIIMGEMLAGILALWGAIKMVWTIRSSLAFAQSKNIFVWSTLMMLTVWYFGFNIVASNAFYMWASTYKAQEISLIFALFALMSLMYVMSPERFD